MSTTLLSDAMAQNCGKICGFAGDFGALAKVNKWKLSDIFRHGSATFAHKGIVVANFSQQRRTWLQLFVAARCVRRNFALQLWADGEKLGGAGGSATAAAHEGQEVRDASATITTLANTTTCVAFHE
jgi:hypothetical protein